MGGPPLGSASTTIETNAGASVGPDAKKCWVSGGSWPMQTAQISHGVVPDLTRFALFSQSSRRPNHGPSIDRTTDLLYFVGTGQPANSPSRFSATESLGVYC